MIETDRQHIFFGSVEEEDDIVPERNVWLCQDLQKLQHNGTTYGVVARSWKWSLFFLCGS